MDQSSTLLSAQVHFLDTNLSLIHIPLHLYSNFLQPLLALLLPVADADQGQADDQAGFDTVRSRRPWAYQHPFINISVTPIECSVVCPSSVARRLFRPVLDALDPGLREQVSISSDEYICIQVDGEGLDAGQRVLELSSPLALNGISIFFITTYFSDYILVPRKSRSAVTTALEGRGFAFSSLSEAFVSVASPLMQPQLGLPLHHRNSSSTSSADIQELQNPSYFSGINSRMLDNQPATSPPTSIEELQRRTFALLSKRGIAPTVDCSMRLVQCAGRRDSLRGDASAQPSSLNMSALHLQLGLVRCLIVSPRPRFLSLTLTDTEPASLLLERGLLANFERPGDDGLAVLLGNMEDALVPITLDLRDLPMESTGIVCGVAGRLVGGTSGGDADDTAALPVEMSYLSTARAGTVMVAEVELERALGALVGAAAGDDAAASAAAATNKDAAVNVVTEAVEIVKLNNHVAGDW